MHSLRVWYGRHPNRQAVEEEEEGAPPPWPSADPAAPRADLGAIAATNSIAAFASVFTAAAAPATAPPA